MTRRQANTLNFVQFVGGHNADSQANENQHNGGVIRVLCAIALTRTARG